MRYNEEKPKSIYVSTANRISVAVFFTFSFAIVFPVAIDREWAYK